jgi:hypothetical protein
MLAVELLRSCHVRVDGQVECKLYEARLLERGATHARQRPTPPESCPAGVMSAGVMSRPSSGPLSSCRALPTRAAPGRLPTRRAVFPVSGGASGSRFRERRPRETVHDGASGEGLGQGWRTLLVRWPWAYSPWPGSSARASACRSFPRLRPSPWWQSYPSRLAVEAPAAPLVVAPEPVLSRTTE